MPSARSAKRRTSGCGSPCNLARMGSYRSGVRWLRSQAAQPLASRTDGSESTASASMMLAAQNGSTEEHNTRAIARRSSASSEVAASQTTAVRSSGPIRASLAQSSMAREPGTLARSGLGATSSSLSLRTSRVSLGSMMFGLESPNVALRTCADMPDIELRFFFFVPMTNPLSIHLKTSPAAGPVDNHANLRGYRIR